MRLSYGILVLSLLGNSAGWCVGVGETPNFRFVGLREVSEFSPAPVLPEGTAVPWTATPHFRKMLESLSGAPYELVLEESSAKIKATKVLTAHGHFEKFSVTASIEKDDFSKSSIQVSLDMNSAVSDSWFLSTKTLKAKLKAAEHPTATLKSLSIKPTAVAGRFEIESDLALMGENHKKTIPVALDVLKDGKLRASGAFAMTVDGTDGTMTFSLVLRRKPMPLDK